MAGQAHAEHRSGASVLWGRPRKRVQHAEENLPRHVRRQGQEVFVGGIAPRRIHAGTVASAHAVHFDVARAVVPGRVESQSEARDHRGRELSHRARHLVPRSSFSVSVDTSSKRIRRRWIREITATILPSEPSAGTRSRRQGPARPSRRSAARRPGSSSPPSSMSDSALAATLPKNCGLDPTTPCAASTTERRPAGNLRAAT